MPVAQSGPPPLRQALLVGLGVVMGILAILFLVTQMDRLTGSVGNVEVSVGDGIYRPGNASELAPAIDENGPLLLPDLAGGDDDFFIQHLGDDPTEGWAAIAVRPQTAARDCFVQWEPDDRTFVDSCGGTVYPEDGAGLPHYLVTVNDDDEILVDLKAVIPATTTPDDG